MKAKFAKGFTLIEIMVVIVIMGVLAAVAVPKLFGSVAKAKSTEIPLAASSYMKIQDVAVMEHGNVGNWKTIGYIAPGNGTTSFFKYNQGNLTDNKTSIEDLGSGLVGWEASNVASLNDCKAGNLWQITITAGESGHVAYNAQVSSDACVSVATSFSQGNIASVGSTEETGSTSVPVGTNLFASATNTQQVGTWHESGVYKPSESYSAWHSIINTSNTEGPYPGSVELEPNTEYTFTISIPENVWDANQGQYMQTQIRVYTDKDAANAPAIMLGTRPDNEMAAEDPNIVGTVKEVYTSGPNIGKDRYPNGNGYNTGSRRADGYTASSSMKTENGMVVTTITMTTGADGGYLGTNIFAMGSGWTAGRESAVNTAISNATLVKTGESKTEEEKEKSSN